MAMPIIPEGFERAVVRKVVPVGTAWRIQVVCLARKGLPYYTPKHYATEEEARAAVKRSAQRDATKLRDANGVALKVGQRVERNVAGRPLPGTVAMVTRRYVYIALDDHPPPANRAFPMNVRVIG